MNKHYTDRYTKFASYYDAIYDEIVDYESQADWIEKIFDIFHNGKIKSILDIGCGTGNYTFAFAKRDHKVTGIDISADMIREAKGKMRPSKNGKKANLPKFYQMDMRNIRFESKGTEYDAATLMFGGFGYLLEYSDVTKFLNSAKRNLKKNGLLVFEFWHASGVHPQASTKSGHLSWVKVEHDNQEIVRLDASKYDSQTNSLHVLFDFYVLDKDQRQLVDWFSEKHILKVYSISEVRNLLERSGFDALGFFKDSPSPAGEVQNAEQSDFRVLAVARNNSSGK